MLTVLIIRPAAAEPATFRFQREIERRRPEEESMTAVVFDADVFAVARDGFPDVRVLDDRGVQTPLLIEEVVEQPVHRRRTSRGEPLDGPNKKIDCAVAVKEITEDATKKTTYIYVDAGGQPITEFDLETTSSNFSRPVRVEVPAERGGWREVGRGKVSIIEYDEFGDRSTTIAFPEQRAAEYRIVIINEDNPPLENLGVSARGNVYRAVFLAEAGRAYRLVYGSPKARRPDYDAAAVLAPLRARGHRPVEAELGPPMEMTAAEPPASISEIVGNPWLLGAAIVVLLVLLVWALYVATRRIDRLPNEP